MQISMTKALSITVGTIIVLFGLLAYFVGLQTSPSLGSVSVTNDYVATTTAGNNLYGSVTGNRLIRTGQGTLGSIIITGANTGIVNFYNATTTVLAQRITATSTILLASIPASTVAGTYTFDVQFTDGLFMEVVSGNMPTSTVTYR